MILMCNRDASIRRKIECLRVIANAVIHIHLSAAVSDNVLCGLLPITDRPLLYNANRKCEPVETYLEIYPTYILLIRR